jgi:hypothetical protein
MIDLLAGFVWSALREIPVGLHTASWWRSDLLDGGRASAA